MSVERVETVALTGTGRADVSFSVPCDVVLRRMLLVVMVPRPRWERWLCRLPSVRVRQWLSARETMRNERELERTELIGFRVGDDEHMAILMPLPAHVFAPHVFGAPFVRRPVARGTSIGLRFRGNRYPVQVCILADRVKS